VITTLPLKGAAKESAKILPVGLYPPLNDEALIFYLLKHEYISEVVPLHSRSIHKENYLPIFDKVMKNYEAPIEDIRYYYGESIAIYFAWCNFMAKWLLIPSIIALFLYLHEKIYGLDSDSAYYNSYFSFGIAVWAPLLVIYWKRYCAELDVKWDNYNLTVN
jgi:anoctamin-10